jgi:hypothetical protein
LSYAVEDLILAEERGVVFDSVFVKGIVVMDNSEHHSQIGVILQDHPGFSCNGTAGGSDSSGMKVLLKEFGHVVQKLLRKHEHTVIDGLHLILKDDMVAGSIGFSRFFEAGTCQQRHQGTQR